MSENIFATPDGTETQESDYAVFLMNPIENWFVKSDHLGLQSDSLVINEPDTSEELQAAEEISNDLLF